MAAEGVPASGNGAGATNGAVLRVSEPARAHVMAARDAEEGAGELGLWVEVSGTRGAEYSYDLYFERIADAGAEDVVHAEEGLTVVIPARSVERLSGALLDLEDGEAGGEPELVLRNPNRPPVRTEAPAGDLTSEEAKRVLELLETEINPAIASHGGYAELVSVENGNVYLRLGGGCQGCGLAQVTLRQGIEVAIREALPGIEEVIDVTDHAGGTNPYYEAAKK